MKLVRFGEAGAERPGMIDAGGVLRDVSGHLDDLAGAALGDASLEKLRALAVRDVIQIGAPPSTLVIETNDPARNVSFLDSPQDKSHRRCAGLFSPR